MNIRICIEFNKSYWTAVDYNDYMPSVALVVLDTLRKDSFDEHFQWLPGTRFEQAYSTSGWTVPAHGSLFTGKYPSESGVYAKFQSLTTGGLVLAEALAEAGYTTRGFSANANISDAFDFTRGFEDFHHSWRGERQKEGIVDWGEFISDTADDGISKYVSAIRESLTADRTVKSLELGVRMKARDWGIESIAGQDDGANKAQDLVESTSFAPDKEFLFLNLMEAHGPYDAPKGYRTVEIQSNPSFEHTIFEGPPEDSETIRQAYDDCVRYLSDKYEEIFATLSEAFDYVFTISDHGEMFGRDGLWAHNYGLYPELTHVPVAIYDGRDHSSTRRDTASLIDVHETICQIAGCQSQGNHGRNLLETRASQDRLVERFGLRDNRAEKLRRRGCDESTVREYEEPIFGIATQSGEYAWQSRRGMQSTNGIEVGEADRLIGDLRAGIKSVEPQSSPAADVPKDVEDRLEELGYL